MRNWLRIFGLVTILVLATFASLSAQYPQYGTCYVYCFNGEESYAVGYMTYGQCCRNGNQFSATCYQVGSYWEPYGEGYSQVCDG